MTEEKKDPRSIDLDKLKLRSIKSLISFRINQLPEVDLIGEIISDNDEYLEVTNPFLALPVQNPGSNAISLGLRPLTMTLSKGQSVIFKKEDILMYFEITNQYLISSYINATSDIQIATPEQIPRDNSGVIDMFSR
jgi:hypothetical protein